MSSTPSTSGSNAPSRSRSFDRRRSPCRACARGSSGRRASRHGSIHPNIVAVLDYGEDHSSSYLVMERLPGTTLRDEIAQRTAGRPEGDARGEPRPSVHSPPPTDSASLHRDIKPSNILLQDDGHTKITDFGIAKSFDVGAGPDQWADDITLTGVVLGTPGYLAPERRSGRSATAQSDLYSVGAVMVEALTGRRPTPGASGSERLPQPFRDVALGAMAAYPGDRFRSAAEMLQALRARPAAPGVVPLPGRTAPRAASPAARAVTPPVARSPQRARVFASPPAAEGSALAVATALGPPCHRWRGGAVRHPLVAAGQWEPTHGPGNLRVLAPRAPLGAAGHRPRARRDQKPRDGPRQRRVPGRQGPGQGPRCGGGATTGRR